MGVAFASHDTQQRRGVKTLHLTNAWHASSGGVGTFYKALFEAANREGHFMSLVGPAIPRASKASANLAASITSKRPSHPSIVTIGYFIRTVFCFPAQPSSASSTA